MKNVLSLLGVAAVATSVSCAPLSRPVTEREQTAAVGGLAGGAGGAIIGSMAGGAVAGGLFGIPIGALAGWYIGDYMANEDRIAQARLEERETELARLRRENEQLRRDEDRPARGAQLSSQEQSISPAQVREVQKKLNDQGYHAGPVDGILGPNTQAAIRNFQEAKGLKATGQLNQETMNALGIEETGRETERKPAGGGDQSSSQTGRESQDRNQQK
jgi:Putative peptidoglycan binding domain